MESAVPESEFSVASLNSSGSLTQNVPCVPPSGMSVGTYYWIAVADPDIPPDYHSESNENNNAGVGSSVSVQ